MKSIIIKKGHNLKVDGVPDLNIYHVKDPGYISFHPSRFKSFKTKLLVKKDDSVKVVSGNYKGQTGRVIKIVNKNNRAIVEGINKVKKHIRPSQDNPQGGIIEKEMSIHISNLMLLNKNKPVKDGFKIDEKTSKKVRFNKSNGDLLD